MKKIFTITAALATTAVMVSSVFAEKTPAMTAEYNAGTGKVILTNAPQLKTTTYIVFDRNGADGVTTETVAQGMIRQINQEENSVTEIYVGPLDNGNYQVRLGGDGSVTNAAFKVASVAPTPSTEPDPTPSTEPAPTPSTEPTAKPRKLGDVDNDGNIKTLDTIPIVNHVAKIITLKDDDYKAADTDGDGAVKTLDTIPIVNFVAKKENTGLGDDIFIK